MTTDVLSAFFSFEGLRETKPTFGFHCPASPNAQDFFRTQGADCGLGSELRWPCGKNALELALLCGLLGYTAAPKRHSPLPDF